MGTAAATAADPHRRVCGHCRDGPGPGAGLPGLARADRGRHGLGCREKVSAVHHQALSPSPEYLAYSQALGLPKLSCTPKYYLSYKFTPPVLFSCLKVTLFFGRAPLLSDISLIILSQHFLCCHQVCVVSQVAVSIFCHSMIGSWAHDGLRLPGSPL